MVKYFVIDFPFYEQEQTNLCMDASVRQNQSQKEFSLKMASLAEQRQ